MNEEMKALKPLIDEFCTENGYKRGRTTIFAQKCCSIGRKMGRAEQRSRDRQPARWEVIGAMIPVPVSNDIEYRLKCGRCHKETWVRRGHTLQYCPKCGARMKVADHGCLPGGAE